MLYLILNHLYFQLELLIDDLKLYLFHILNYFHLILKNEIYYYYSHIKKFEYLNNSIYSCYLIMNKEYNFLLILF